MNKHLPTNITIILSVFLSGCVSQTIPTNSISIPDRSMSEEKINQLPLSDFTREAYLDPNHVDLDTISNDNYYEILKERKSGVFQHPFYPSKFLTIYQKGADIDQELKRYGLYESFLFQFGDYKFERNLDYRVAGVHFIAQNHIEKDANLTYLNSKMGLVDPNFHRGYYLLMHEIGHSLNSQWEYIVDYQDRIVVLENASEILATVMLYQLVLDEGYDINYFKRIIKREKRTAKTTEASHRTQHIFDVMLELIELNHEYFFYLSKPEVEAFSWQLALKFSYYDYDKKRTGLQDITSSYYRNSKEMKNTVKKEIANYYSLAIK